MNPIIDKHESEVRGYCRAIDTTFESAAGSWLIDAQGKRYLDFLAGAGVLNYGHNPPALKARLLEYIERDGISHSLDLYSSAKAHFLQRLSEVILEPRGLDFKVQFPGPTGTNAVEAAMKLARKVSGRSNIVFFSNAFHGMTCGSLAVTGNGGKRASAGQALANTTAMPFDGQLGEDIDSLVCLERALEDPGSGVDKPAAVIVETVQAEGGVNVASRRWLQRLAALCRAHDVLLIVDDIQLGCGRSGDFFSFEDAGIKPDMVTLSKSLSGYGLPLAVVLIRPDIDLWSPGEHNGTFRGNNPAFVTAAAALDFWDQDLITPQVTKKGPLMRERLEAIVAEYPVLEARVRGRGFIWGMDCGADRAAKMIAAASYQRGLVIETSGINDQVLKCLAPLTIDEADMNHGLDIVAAAAAEVAERLNNNRSAA